MLAVRSFSTASLAPFSGESSVKVTFSLMTGTVFPSLVKLDTQTVNVRLLFGSTSAVVMTGAPAEPPVLIGRAVFSDELNGPRSHRIGGAAAAAASVDAERQDE